MSFTESIGWEKRFYCIQDYVAEKIKQNMFESHVILYVPKPFPFPCCISILKPIFVPNCTDKTTE